MDPKHFMWSRLLGQQAQSISETSHLISTYISETSYPDTQTPKCFRHHIACALDWWTVQITNTLIDHTALDESETSALEVRFSQKNRNIMPKSIPQKSSNRNFTPCKRDVKIVLRIYILWQTSKQLRDFTHKYTNYKTRRDLISWDTGS